MVHQPKELSAYYEAARVYYTYKAGYFCEGLQISTIDPGGGISRLNSGSDSVLIQAILSGSSPIAEVDINQQRSKKVALSLIKIYCAGACSQYFLKNLSMSQGEVEIEIPGADMKNLQKIQDYLEKYSDLEEDVIASTIQNLILEYKDVSIWECINGLATTILHAKEGSISRFQIEDSFIKCGFIDKNNLQNRSVGFALKEDDTKKEIKSNPPSTIPNITKSELLDQMLTKFLFSLKENLTDDEINKSIRFLKKIIGELSE